MGITPSRQRYISSSLRNTLTEKWVSLIRNTRKHMKQKVMKLWDRPMLRKRFIIEIVFEQLRYISKIEHFRHRSGGSFMVTLFTLLI
nr:transposase [Candidatus Enterovibrio escacola]